MRRAWKKGFHSGDEETADPTRKPGGSRGVEAGKQGQAANNGSGPTRLKTRSNGRVRKSKAALIKGEIRERRTKRGLTVT